MTTTTDRPLDAAAEARRDALAGQLFAAVLGSLELQAVYLGERLGLYRALAEGGPATAPELAARAGIDARYAREWLEQQAVAAILEVDDASAAPDARRYTLPAGHEAVLLDPESLALMAPLARFVVGSAATMPRSARGVPHRRRGRLGGLRPGRRRGPGGHQPTRSSTISSATGSARCRTSRLACGRPRSRRGRGLRDRASRRSPSPARSRACTSTASTSTRARSPAPRRNARGRGSDQRVVPPRRRGERGRCRHATTW